MAENQPSPQPIPRDRIVNNICIALTVIAFIVVAGGVSIWGDDLKGGRFFISLAPLIPGLLLLWGQRAHSQQAATNNAEVSKKLDVVEKQTNGQTLTQVRDAQREQLMDDPAYLDAVVTAVFKKMQDAAVLEAAARKALELAQQKQATPRAG